MTEDLQRRLSSAFQRAFDGAPDVVARAPGRVNLIG
ncbi:MAG: galactokinase family protein, partial [Parvularculaceae bacterium]|nr:galactokinase family protein [Parvularculaceae bacterium]